MKRRFLGGSNPAEGREGLHMFGSASSTFSSNPVLEFFWWMFMFYLFFAVIMMFIQVFADIFRRENLTRLGQGRLDLPDLRRAVPRHPDLHDRASEEHRAGPANDGPRRRHSRRGLPAVRRRTTSPRRRSFWIAAPSARRSSTTSRPRRSRRGDLAATGHDEPETRQTGLGVHVAQADEERPRYSGAPWIYDGDPVY